MIEKQDRVESVNDPMITWQPIETAPRDGRRILARDEEAVILLW